MGQRIIGLTGGIATGKSTVGQYLADRHGLPVLDADEYARRAVEPGSPILAAIAQRYGQTLLLSNGALNRPQLGQIIFSDGAEKTWVEQQIHPFVRQCFATAMTELAAAPTVVHMIPLLFEADLTAQVTEIWVVACSPTLQLERLMTRNALSQEAAQSRIQNQWPLAQKVQQADVVLTNETTLPQLYIQVEKALAG
ncbi:MAG: dephospho-CoA kinase [Leptolyngbyaceae cyanobacterium]